MFKRLFATLLLTLALAAPASAQFRLTEWANNASSTLDANINDVVTSLTVASGDGAKFPSPTGGEYMWITLKEGSTIEILKCTARTADEISGCTRAQQSTAASAFTTAATVYLAPTAEDFNAIKTLTGLSFLVNAATTELSAELVMGTGIAAALQLNTGSAGAPVLFNGALGTPSSGTATNITGLPTAGLTFAATNRILCRDTAGAGVGEECTASAILAMISANQGDVLYHNGTSWVALGAGTAGQYLQTGGAGANPTWAAGAGGGLATTDIDTSAELRTIIGDESGTGAILFAGGAIGNATGTSLSFGADPGDAGPIRLSNATGLTWEAATPGTDLTLTMNGSDVLVSSQQFQVPTEAYDEAGWNGDLTVPTKDAVRDEMESFLSITDPNVDAVMFWDDSAGNIVAATASAVSFSTTTMSITIPKTYYFRLAACQDATASVGVDVHTSGGAAAACVTGTNANRGAITLPDASTAQVQGGFKLPANYSGTISAKILWRTSATTNEAEFKVGVACTAVGETLNDTFVVTDILDTAGGTTLNLNVASANLTTTGCAADEHLQWRLLRDPADADDDLATDLLAFDIEFRVPEVF
jgi:hypothetical protein